MDIWTFLGQVGLGLPLGLAAIGSALGIYTAGQSAVGAWGKDAKEGKPLSFAYIILAGMPLSQTIYAFIFTLEKPIFCRRVEIVWRQSKRPDDFTLSHKTRRFSFIPAISTIF